MIIEFRSKGFRSHHLWFISLTRPKSTLLWTKWKPNLTIFHHEMKSKKWKWRPVHHISFTKEKKYWFLNICEPWTRDECAIFSVYYLCKNVSLKEIKFDITICFICFRWKVLRGLMKNSNDFLRETIVESLLLPNCQLIA